MGSSQSIIQDIYVNKAKEAKEDTYKNLCISQTVYFNSLQCRDDRIRVIMHKILNHRQLTYESIVYINNLDPIDRFQILDCYNTMIEHYIEIIDSDYK